MGKKPPRIRKGRKYPVKETLDLIRRKLKEGFRLWEFDGDFVLIDSKRIRTFLKAPTCQCCGLEGLYFVKEKHRNDKRGDTRFVLALWGNFDGREVELTSDHIHPLRRGGSKTSLKNRQTLCSYCNQTKGHKIIDNAELLKRVEKRRGGHYEQKTRRPSVSDRA